MCFCVNSFSSDIKGVDSTDITKLPLMFIDTAGCNFAELNLPNEMSKGNESKNFMFVYFQTYVNYRSSLC